MSLATLPHQSQPYITTDELNQFARRIHADLQAEIAADQHNMGNLEETIFQDTQELQRQLLQRAAQAKADQTPPNCPKCGQPLSRVSNNNTKTIESRFGPIEINRQRGYCQRCETWVYPADHRLGLQKNAHASPTVQEAAALAVSKMPAANAAAVVERLSGMKISRATLDQEARRQGKKAVEKRREMDEKAYDTRGRWGVTAEVSKDLPKTPFTLVIEIDAWNIRERDDWGKTQELRAKGESLSRWHWVYGATIFRLGDRVKTQSDRPMILSRGHVMTREGLDSFSVQLWGEAVRQGVLKAETVLVVADGGVWIWNLVNDRFPHAEKRLDFYHASQHLWTVAHALYGKGTDKAKRWVEPLLHQLKHGGEAGVLQTLADLKETLSETESSFETVSRECGYFENHRDHLDYKSCADRGFPIGSGAMESTCRQYQCRFKRPGQFWTTAGDEALLALETFWRNGRWDTLYPHAPKIDPAKN